MNQSIIMNITIVSLLTQTAIYAEKNN